MDCTNTPKGDLTDFSAVDFMAGHEQYRMYDLAQEPDPPVQKMGYSNIKSMSDYEDRQWERREKRAEAQQDRRRQLEMWSRGEHTHSDSQLSLPTVVQQMNLNCIASNSR